MIPAIHTPRQPPRAAPGRTPSDWQRELQRAISDPAELLGLLELPAAQFLAPARAAARTFPLRVPRGFVARMRKRDPRDPLLRQVLPLEAELQAAPGFGLDPVGDLAARRGEGAGVLHKYHARALLITTGACAVHCRYCFRRHFPYTTETAAREDGSAALAALRADPSICEAILSGGDPLSLGNRRLTDLLEALDELPQLRRVRIHTRLPIVLPERVDTALLEAIGSLRVRTVVVVHANHANEIDGHVAGALAALAGAGATLLNQSVLLRGVNDSAEALCDLSERLFEVGVQPYYLHLLDRVAGAAHFEVPEAEGRELIGRVAARLPGYLVPRLAREEAGAAAKTIVPPASR